MVLLTHERQWRGGETVVAFGMFDGVHEGHAQLMRKANELAALHDLKSVVYTFSSHPMATYAPEKTPPQLETRSEKIRSIAQLGIDAAVLRPLDRAYAAQSPEAFVQAFVDALHPKHVVIGFNYSFGRMGAGKAEDMRRFGENTALRRTLWTRCRSTVCPFPPHGCARPLRRAKWRRPRGCSAARMRSAA